MPLVWQRCEEAAASAAGEGGLEEEDRAAIVRGLASVAAMLPLDEAQAALAHLAGPAIATIQHAAAPQVRLFHPPLIPVRTPSPSLILSSPLLPPWFLFLPSLPWFNQAPGVPRLNQLPGVWCFSAGASSRRAAAAERRPQSHNVSHRGSQRPAGSLSFFCRFYCSPWGKPGGEPSARGGLSIRCGEP